MTDQPTSRFKPGDQVRKRFPAGTVVSIIPRGDDPELALIELESDAEEERVLVPAFELVVVTKAPERKPPETDRDAIRQGIRDGFMFFPRWIWMAMALACAAALILAAVDPLGRQP